MSDKLRIIAENYADTSILTSTPSMAISIDNLKDYTRSRISRTQISNWNPIYNQEIGIQLPSLKTISAIVLGRHNFNVGMGIKFILYDAIDFDNTTGIELYNSGDLIISSTEAVTARIGWGLFSWGDIPWGGGESEEELAPKQNYVHWVYTPGIIGDELLDTITGEYLFETGTKISLIDTGGIYSVPEGIGTSSVLSMKIFFNIANGIQIDISRLIIGDYIEPTYNINYNSELEWYEDSKQYRTEANTLRSDVGIPYRKLKFSLNSINELDRNSLIDSFRYIGKRKDFYINLYPNSIYKDKERDYSGIMKLTKEPIISEFANNLYKSKYVMEEV